MSTAVRISRVTHEKLRRLAEADGLSLTEALDRAIEAYRRDLMLRDVNRAYSVLRERSRDWEQELKERDELEGAIGDGLVDDD